LITTIIPCAQFGNFLTNVIEHNVTDPEYHRLIDDVIERTNKGKQDLLAAAKVLHKLGYSKKRIRNQLRRDIESRLPDDEAGLQLAFDDIDHLRTKYKD
jgi:hypothetical protein